VPLTGSAARPWGTEKKVLAPEPSSQPEPAAALPTKPLTKQPTGEAEGVGDTEGVPLKDLETLRVEEALLPVLTVGEGEGVGEKVGQVTTLSSWLVASATTMEPEGVMATPLIWLNEAEVTGPLSDPIVVPARVDTREVARSMLRTL
jgi:hypothetical protein